MIFDSPQMQRLCRKYGQQPEACRPLSVRLAQFPEMSGERAYIEELVAAAPPGTQAAWIAGLTHEKDGEFLPDWFEIMLFGWLRGLGQVVVEPQILGDVPDFALRVDNQQIVIEAKTVLRQPRERVLLQRQYAFIDCLSAIRQSFVVELHNLELPNPVDAHDLTEQVTRWLQTAAEKPFEYADGRGNSASLRTHMPGVSDRLNVEYSDVCLYPNPESLKPALRKKAAQHKQIRDAGYPYILAILEEAATMEGEEFVEAWLGANEYIYDFDADEVVGHRFRPSGLHFRGEQIQHKTVSGTLVFRARWSEQLLRNELKAWYLENPFASTPVDPLLFPALSRYVVVSPPGDPVKVGWQGDQT